MNKVYELFRSYFVTAGKNDFQIIKDMCYYKGGWPSEHTPPRLESLVKRMAIVAKYYKYLGKEEELKMYCEKYGVTIESNFSDSDIELSESIETIDDDTMELWEQVFANDPIIRNRKEAFSKMLDEAMEIQGAICAEADEIKINHGRVIEEECGIKKNNFVNAVSIQSRLLNQANVDKAVNKRVFDGTNIVEAISIFVPATNSMEVS
jgi:hypothetical protein